MKISDYMRNTVDRLPRGYVFTYTDFSPMVKSKEALIKTLNRMASSSMVTKLSKGKYYKPEQSPFGDLPPNQYQVVKDLLESGGKVEGYLTGLSVYNNLGLTTQVGSIIQIGKNDIRPSFKRGKYTIYYVKQKNIITKENIPLFQILDALRFIKKIPDAGIKNSCLRLKIIIEKLTDKEQRTTIRLAMKYQPSTRALLGAILSDLGKETITVKLKKSLNPITLYDIPGATAALVSAQSWSLK